MNETVIDAHKSGKISLVVIKKEAITIEGGGLDTYIPPSEEYGVKTHGLFLPCRNMQAALLTYATLCECLIGLQ